LYGAALYYARQYDGVTMGFDQVLWSYGGQLSDPSGKKIEGVLNSPEGVKALEFYAGLKKSTPPGSENHYFAECLTAFQEGQVAMAQSWFAFLPDLVNKDKNKFADKTGYFVVPKGPAGHFISLGGQGMSVSSYSNKKDQGEAVREVVPVGRNTKEVGVHGRLDSELESSEIGRVPESDPVQRVFAESVPHLKDFYNTPEYSELLEPGHRTT
jgi:multiple sugar transport system substrate-binding protein